MRVYVTGIGVVSGLGLGVSQQIHSIRKGLSGMGSVAQFATKLSVPVSEVKHSNRQLLEPLLFSEEKGWTRTALLGFWAAQEALIDSSINPQENRVGFISSTSVGGMDRSENFYRSYMNDSESGRLHDVISHDCGDSTERIARHLGITGFTTTISTACSSAANAIMLGARMIKHGMLDAVIVGGTDALCSFTLNGFHSLMILDEAHCRPFDRSRAGLNLGEGAGYLVLQNEATVQKEPYCLLSGYGNANDAYHQTGSSPNGEGAYLCMKKALEIANLDSSEISYINVHGTGTPTNDLSEGIAMKRLFGESVPAFSSVKSIIGHTLGASEGIEAVLSALSVKKGYIYPNLQFTEPDEEIGLIPETTWKEGAPIRHVLSNSFGFGGNDSALIFSVL